MGKAERKNDKTSRICLNFLSESVRICMVERNEKTHKRLRNNKKSICFIAPFDVV